MGYGGILLANSREQYISWLLEFRLNGENEKEKGSV
jgi:hypothetical protein